MAQDGRGGAVPAPTDYELFDLGDLVLQGGATIRGAQLAYKTYGGLAADKSNVIVYPTWFGAWHDANDRTIGQGKALDPDRDFIVVPNQINNGLSSSPSNTPPPFNGPHFPPVTFYDQVEAQHRLITQQRGIESVELVLGSSMGAGQTYPWAVSHPEMVKRAAPIVGSAITSEHNQVFLKSLRAALTLDPVFDGGLYSSDEPPTRGAAGLRAHLRRLGALPGLLLAARVPKPGVLLARGLPRRVLGRVLARRTRPQQPAGHALDLGAR
jgi:homoserine O-acetyltransferase